MASHATETIPFTTPPAYPVPEGEVEPLTGWPFVVAWVGLFVGSWALVLALVALIWWAARGVAAGV